MNRPVRLAKQDNQSYSCKFSLMDKVDAWCNHHALLLFTILMIVLIFLFVTLAYALIGVSATESGTVYNHLGDVI